MKSALRKCNNQLINACMVDVLHPFQNPQLKNITRSVDVTLLMDLSTLIFNLYILCVLYNYILFFFTLSLCILLLYSISGDHLFHRVK